MEKLRFSNSFARLEERFFSRVAPTPLNAPYLVSASPAAARLLDLDLETIPAQTLAEYFGGIAPLPDSEPLAMVYAGHQFGHYVPELGDGRAILLGEVTNSAGERWELQLKGAGMTPYSRDGDGRAVLRSTLREYLCSEAMHGLGIPTTRALCMIGSDEEVYREQIETGALLLRMAPSHVRFGSFEYFYYRGKFNELRTLADYLIDHHYPALRDEPNPYLALYRAVVERTAKLIADWQLVGFAHGVLNTDNMSMLGLTLDYGPFGFLDDYEPGFICNHSDYAGRYAFNRQPDIGLWNLSCLGQALLPLFHEDGEQAAAMATAQFDHYQDTLNRRYTEGMAAKLGLRGRQESDLTLAHRLLDLMAGERRDYTNTFRALGDFRTDTPSAEQAMRDLFIDRAAFDSWAEDYRARLIAERSDDDERRARMNRTNPRYVLRNYLAQHAIDRARDKDFSEIETLLKLVGAPFDEHPEFSRYAEPAPDWGKKLSISCSS